MRTCYVAFDTETYRIVPGRLAPTPVVLTFTTSNGTEKAVTPDEGARLLRAWCEDASTIIIGHNVAFDMGVMVAAYPDLVEPVFTAYAAGRVRDTVLREKLIRLASGEMSSDFGAGSKMTSFSMEAVFKVRFNEDLSALKTGDDAWRINYHRLAGVPLEQWPKDAIDYAMGDATRTMRLFLAQGKDDSLVVDVATGAVTNEQEQVAAAWGLHLAGVWGLRTDPHAVAALARRLDEREADVINLAGILYAVQLRQLIADENTQGAVGVQFKTRFTPLGSEVVKTYTIDSPYTAVRFSGRQVEMKITGDSMTDWRVGVMRLDAIAGGER